MDSKTVARRRHSRELKTEVLAACAEPGASVAAVALAHGLNANLVHKWRRGKDCGLASPGSRTAVGEFIALPLGVTKFAHQAPVALACCCRFTNYVKITFDPTKRAEAPERLEALTLRMQPSSLQARRSKRKSCAKTTAKGESSVLGCFVTEWWWSATRRVARIAMASA